MSIVMSTPGIQELDYVTEVLSGWQCDEGPLHLHPGDLGWYSLRGAAKTAASLRAWSREGKILALGLLDGSDGLLRMAVDPDLRDDDELSRQLVADVNDPQRGVLDAGNAIVEARGADRFSQLLSEEGWQPEEPWTPLRRDLSASGLVDEERVEETGLRIETIGPDLVDPWVAVHWSAFKGTQFSEEERRDYRELWLTMARGPFYHRARSLAAFDGHDNAVAVTTVWSAGPGRPGLLEPMGVHRDHRGNGYGVAISVAAASALQEMGSSSAIVCAESSNAAAVSTYVAAGFTAHEQVADLQRGA
ncbi:GNAT family N-acetyltransferase [uncultured Arthrobacter sp.]|uniref:GNAT family N-acetyltransferase n=1 Tax=uncultured Arthrobacter sp. TaxID=114050 RepID=UPI00262C84DA|nr:GNAT family N-acetyltransferase [uncultured Arthrobacter sp.]